MEMTEMGGLSERPDHQGCGVSADYLVDRVDNYGGGDLAGWIGDGCTGMEGSYEDDEIAEAMGYQLVEYY